MPPSFLRKKNRQPSAQPTSPTSPKLRHSLSLPDLTAPLLDTSSWEEVPLFTFSPGPSGAPPPKNQTQVQAQRESVSLGGGGQGRPRNRKPSLVGHEVQFHRPFTPKLVASPTNGWGDAGDDFRVSATRWGRDGQGGLGGMGGGAGWRGSIATRPDVRQSMASVVSRRKRGKKGAVEKLNVVVAGGKGVGKTSFINLLTASLAETQEAPTRTPRPTTRPRAYTTLSNLADRQLLRIIDTPGLELSAGDPVKEKERERGVAGLVMMVEERFEEMLREERKVRRQVGAEEGLIHLVIYLLDARDVLRPEASRQAKDVDWSCVGLFDESIADVDIEPVVEEVDAGPKVSSVEIDIIRRLEKRTNVLPIVSHTDSLTSSELQSVRSAVRSDLGAAFAGTPGKGFGVFMAGDDESLRSNSVKEEDMDVDQADPRPPTPDSIHSAASTISPAMPYSIFVPEARAIASSQAVNTAPGEQHHTRHFAWGSASVLDPAHSDFVALRDAVLGEYSKVLRTTTREVMYESYRTEKLLKQSSGK
ncbi:hypothetical protein IAT38_000716 [Cryptococcus sp. DSM 104549]